MLHYKIKISDNAKRDIRKISNYIEEYRLRKVYKKISQDIENLKFMPRIHKTIYSYRDKNGEYRRIVSEKYSIIYKIYKDEITILRIFNQKQDYLNQRNFILKEKSQNYIILK